MSEPLATICQIRKVRDDVLGKYVQAHRSYQTILEDGIIPETHDQLILIGIQKGQNQSRLNALLSDHSAVLNRLD